MVGAGCFESGRDLWLPQRGGGLRVARKIATKITQRTRILSDNSLVGQREELLKDLSVEFRYLVEGNYKILYYTLPEKVVISLVFDCRQNSEKMRDIKYLHSGSLHRQNVQTDMACTFFMLWNLHGNDTETDADRG